jgi:hypothetical protein
MPHLFNLDALSWPHSPRIQRRSPLDNGIVFTIAAPKRTIALRTGI